MLYQVAEDAHSETSWNLRCRRQAKAVESNHLCQIFIFVWIKWIGTHGEYDKIDVTEVKYERT